MESPNTGDEHERGDEHVRAGAPPDGRGSGSADRPSSSTDHLGRLGRLVRKELLEILRDRRTIITLVLMPILLYPLLSIAFQQLALAGKVGGPQEEVEAKVGFSSELEGKVFGYYVNEGSRFLPPQQSDGGAVVTLNTLTSDLEGAVRAGEIALGVRVRNAADVAAGRGVLPAWEFLYFRDPAPAAFGARVLRAA